MAKFTVDDFRIAYVFDIEEPIPEDKLSKGLEERGFSVQKNRYISSPNLPIRITILNIANKGKISVMYQKDSIPSFLGISGKDTNEVLKQFEVLENLLQYTDPFILQQKKSIEAVVTAKLWSDKIPANEIPKMGGGVVKTFGSALGANMRLISGVIAPESNKEDEGWWLRIEQLAGNPKYYFIQYVRRGLDKKQILSDSYASGEFIVNVIDLLEKAK